MRLRILGNYLACVSQKMTSIKLNTEGVMNNPNKVFYDYPATTVCMSRTRVAAQCIRKKKIIMIIHEDKLKLPFVN